MSYFQHPIFYALLMCVAGFGIPIMAALNAGLGIKLQSPALATTILFFLGGVVSLVYLLLSGGASKLPIQAPIPILFYMGGLLVLFYIACITLAAPKFGLAKTISFVLLGQMISMLIIDHFALFGALRYSISMQRIAGLSFMILGVNLIVYRY